MSHHRLRRNFVEIYFPTSSKIQRVSYLQLLRFGIRLSMISDDDDNDDDDNDDDDDDNDDGVIDKVGPTLYDVLTASCYF